MAPGSGDSWTKTLLDSLQALYSKLSVLILNRRMDSYRKESSQYLDKQILTTLYDIVEKTPKSDNLKADAGDVGPVTQPATGASNRAAKVQQHSAPTATSYTDLSSHLHTSLSKSSDSGHLREKLKSSAWDHIHTSLSYVRQGNPDLAKMHADLANEALLQVSHHMSDEENIELKSKVLEELQKLR